MLSGKGCVCLKAAGLAPLVDVERHEFSHLLPSVPNSGRGSQGAAVAQHVTRSKSVSLTARSKHAKDRFGFFVFSAHANDSVRALCLPSLATL